MFVSVFESYTLFYGPLGKELSSRSRVRAWRNQHYFIQQVKQSQNTKAVIAFCRRRMLGGDPSRGGFWPDPIGDG